METVLLVSLEKAEAICRSRYGLEATCSKLPGYDDLNFAVTTDERERYVLKLSADSGATDRWEIENDVLRALALKLGTGAVPSVVPGLDGTDLAQIDVDGEGVCVRLLTFLPGSPVSTLRNRSPELLRSAGVAAGKLHNALRHVSSRRSDTVCEWDIRFLDRQREFSSSIESVEDQQLVEKWLSRFEHMREGCEDELEISLTHNDLNDGNLLVNDDGSTISIIDFGDMIETYSVAEPAIALAYLMMRQEDPVLAGCSFLEGYSSECSLTPVEANCLFDFVMGRLVLSVIMAARQRRAGASDPYLFVSEQSSWDLLRYLDDRNKLEVVAAFRNAVGLEAHHNCSEVTRYLQAISSYAFPVDVERDESFLELDFSVASSVFPPGRPHPVGDAVRIEEILRSSERTCALGRYNEARLCYAADQYRGSGGVDRTIHLGVDVFKPAGTPVRAVLDGEVAGFESSGAELDYGNVVILRHTTDGGAPFFSLYGHLSDHSLDSLAPGTAVDQGEKIGELGATDENGGWVPHLHFQWMVDMLGFSDTFPGVASPEYRQTWLELCPDPNIVFKLPDGTVHTATVEDLIARRRRVLSNNLSLSYDKPLHIVRGIGQYLYDSDGRQYLDCVNNVCHVGHCHPRVVDSGSRQMRVLNTNTRYLHENILEYADALLATFPEPLSVCFFVNSGSEANDLALRLARTATGNKQIITLEAAYHGNLDALIDISPYKFDGPGGRPVQDDVLVAPLPDVFRGKYTGKDAGRAYAGEVERILEEGEEGPAAFIAESMPGCAGQIVFPEDYLAGVYRAVRSRGGLCIADEVQVGFGRPGRAFWGFELQNVVPDIVTLGKPMGNGHPVGGVVTTRAIADRFANGMEYFNTFGGNPVSCAIGHEVLKVIQDEGLQENALHTGEFLKQELKRLAEKHTIIGDVRGEGLFIGVELVNSPKTLAPASIEAAHVIRRLRNNGILLSIDGPHHNVLKIKPPLVFTHQNAIDLVDSLDKVLS